MQFFPASGRQDITAALSSAAAKLPVSRLAYATMKNGGADFKILCIGDSTTVGYGSSTTGTVPAFNAYPIRLAEMLGGAAGIANGRRDVSFFDNRWTVPAGYITSEWAWKGYETSSSILPLVFTPGTGATYDRFDVYTITNPGGGTLTITGTGGAAVGPYSLNSAASIIKTTCSCPASSSAAVSMVASGQVWVLAVEPWLSTTPRIRVGNVGVNGWLASDWIAAGSFSPLVAVTTHAPHLCIVSLGLNDCAAAVTTAQFYTNLKSLCVSLKALGSDVALWIPTPPGPSGVAPVLLEPGIRSYLPIYRAIANELNLVLFDPYIRHGSAYQAAYSFDGYHSNNLGYRDIAETIAAPLQAILGI
jgi:lysophospholipase L1-like esterase